MENFNGTVSSIYCGSAIDGTGLRCVVFMSGCNYRCGFCHNPETFSMTGEKYLPEELATKLLRYKNYISGGGGVTFSGGEPFLQEDFCAETALLLKSHKIHTAVETNGSIVGGRLIAAADMFIADIKNQDGKIPENLSAFIEKCLEADKHISFTNVVIKGVNDDIFTLSRLKEYLSKYGLGAKITFLPFKKLCISKYRELNIPFTYEKYEENLSAQDIALLYSSL